jgi:hypothetical protein
MECSKTSKTSKRPLCILHPTAEKKPQRQNEEKEKNLPITSKHTFWSSAAAAAAAASYCFG